jgi:hypothetical protein
MKLSKKYLLLVPAASFLLAAAVGSGACSSTGTAGLVVGTVPPSDTFPDGVVIGDSCAGQVFVTGGTGYAFCDSSDKWAYTATDPSGDSYTPFTGDDSGDDSTPGDDSGDDTSAPGDDSTAPADDSGDDSTAPGDASGDDSSGPSGDSGGDDTGSADAGAADTGA